jgi:cobalamin biosynthesis protein CobD/CbiB
VKISAAEKAGTAAKVAPVAKTRTARAADWPLAGGILAGVLADALAGDPRRGHPVALFGQAATRIERSLYADRKTRGAAFTACCEALAIGPALAAARLFRQRPVAQLAWAGTVTWAVTGARSLTREAERIQRALLAGDLRGARRLLPNLCGRDPAQLDEAGIARAVVESVAENCGDAIVAPLLWGALAGPPGLAAYRAANTLDAMVGHHSPRYERFGWASARLDDVANWAPARVTALLADRDGIRAQASEPERRLVRSRLRGRARPPAGRTAQLLRARRAPARARYGTPARPSRHRPCQPPMPGRDRGRHRPRGVTGPVGCASDPNRTLSATPATPTGAVDGVGDRSGTGGWRSGSGGR